MDHDQAQATNAAERYLLGEMSEPERFDFESHYFECKECAGDVRAVHAFAEGVKAEGQVADLPSEKHAGAGRRPVPRWLLALAAGLGLVALVFNFLDIMAHGRSESELLTELAPDETVTSLRETKDELVAAVRHRGV